MIGIDYAGRSSAWVVLVGAWMGQALVASTALDEYCWQEIEIANFVGLDWRQLRHNHLDVGSVQAITERASFEETTNLLWGRVAEKVDLLNLDIYPTEL